MSPRLGAAGEWLRRRAENILSMMLLAMFLVFVMQIVFRYVLNLSIGWTHEISVALWIWIVLFGCAFVIREADEIRFDLIYSGVGPRVRRVMGIITAVAVLILYAGSLPATVDYVQFMHVEKTAYIKIPFNWLYSIYILFAVAVIARYAWILSRLLRGQDAVVSDDSPAVSSGL